MGIAGDVCHTAAYAHELTRYGLPVGHTNYAAAYCTGLLCARRLLQKYKLDTKFPGTEEVTAEFDECYVHNEEDDEDGPAAFHALLDVGLKCTTLGSKVFAAMKGAFDGGLMIPTSTRIISPSSSRLASAAMISRNSTARSMLPSVRIHLLRPLTRRSQSSPPTCLLAVVTCSTPTARAMCSMCAAISAPRLSVTTA